MKGTWLVNLLILIFIISCKNDSNVEVSLDKVLPRFCKKSDEISYQIDKSTKYIRQNIFSKSANAMIDDRFTINTKINNGQSYLHQFPNAMYVDKNGNIYLNNWKKVKRKVRSDFEGSEIVKFNRTGKIVKRVNSLVNVNFIHAINDDAIVVGGNKSTLVFDFLTLRKRGNPINISESFQITDWSSLLKPSYWFLQQRENRFYRDGSYYLLGIDIQSGTLVSSNTVWKTKPTLPKEDSWLYHAKKRLNQFNFHHIIRKLPSVYIAANTGSETFYTYTAGIDQFGKKYFANATFFGKGKISYYVDRPVSYIVVQSKDNKKVWKLNFPYLYGKADINALGGRTYHVTPSGIVYILNVHPKYGIHLDKYVPEPVAKKAGGASKAYY